MNTFAHRDRRVPATLAGRVAYDSLRMSMIDPEQERQRLAQLYRGMTDEELQAVEQDRESLTDIAREALRNELAIRHIAERPEEVPAAADESEQSDLVSIRRFSTTAEALLARSVLQSAGVECLLAEENVIGLMGNVIGGARLLVSKEDEESALAILDQSTSEPSEGGE